MWGYSCGTAVATNPAPAASCLPLSSSPTVPLGAWSPVIITVPTGQDLTINLTNNLPVPTSLVIVGQLGGGLGSVGASCGGSVSTGSTCTLPPDHTGAQAATTWPIAGGAGTTAPA